jgi:hypothetical protein
MSKSSKLCLMVLISLFLLSSTALASHSEVYTYDSWDDFNAAVRSRHSSSSYDNSYHKTQNYDSSRWEYSNPTYRGSSKYSSTDWDRGYRKHQDSFKSYAKSGQSDYRSYSDYPSYYSSDYKRIKSYKRDSYDNYQHRKGIAYRNYHVSNNRNNIGYNNRNEYNDYSDYSFRQTSRSNFHPTRLAAPYPVQDRWSTDYTYIKHAATHRHAANTGVSGRSTFTYDGHPFR